MAPSAEVFSRFKEPSNFDSDYASERGRDTHRFPAKPVDGINGAQYTPSGLRSHHYADSEPATRSRYDSLSRSRSYTPSSAKRSRKTSSTARELVRAILHEKLETDASTEGQLARAYEIIREESHRAAQAERDAVETAQRLKALAISRANAQKNAAQAQAELRAYKLQLENAQRQLEEANNTAAQSDAERHRAEQIARKLKRAMEKLRLSEEVRRAREEGLREGLQESYYGAPPPRSTRRIRVPLIEDDDEDDFVQTPTSNVPLPVPPPVGEPIISRRAATPTFYRAQTPTSATRDWRGMDLVPDVVRYTSPPTMPALSRRVETPHVDFPITADDYDYLDQSTRVPPAHINPEPDHIIIRSPQPRHPERDRDAISQTPPAAHPSYPARPPSSQAGRHGTPHQDVRGRRQPRHYSLDDPAARAAASASRIYEHYNTSSSSSTMSSETSPPMRPPSRYLRRRDDLPQQETIVPRPATASNHNQPHRFTDSPPVRPPSAADSIPASAAALHRSKQRQSLGQNPNPAQIPNRRRTSVSSSSTSSSSVAAFPTPSSVARLQRLPLPDRTWSGESASSVPAITIQPPSRSESANSLETGAAHPSHMSPFIDHQPVLPSDVQTSAAAAASAWGVPPRVPSQAQHHEKALPHRPASRTRFMYGSGMAGTGGPPLGPPIAGPSAFASPSSPSMQPSLPSNATAFGVGPMGSEALPHLQHMNGHARGHRREPARVGDSVDSLPTGFGGGGTEGPVIPPPHPNPYISSSSDEDDDDDDEFGRRAPTPRAMTPFPRPAPAAFDERRAGFDDRRGSLAGPGTPSAHSVHGGFVPPRPPSSAGSARVLENMAYDSPHRVPLPASTSASTSAYPSRSASAAPNGGRNRKTSFANGGRKNGASAGRTAFGNTPFVRSSGLDD